MTTFSQMVDDLVAETRRKDLKADIATYLNQTIREAHSYPSIGQTPSATIFYAENLREELLESDLDVNFGWAIPDPTTFQGIGLVRYDSIQVRDDISRYPSEKTPSRGLIGSERFYYRAGGNFYFAGYGGVGAKISLAYYAFCRRLKYYAVDARPGEYDSDMGWTYAPEFDTTPELRLAAQAFTTNWMLMRWNDVISEGVRAKIYKRLSDTDRARTSFSQYTTLRMGLVTAESAQLGGFG
jgi:hypothetical protein